MSSPHKERPRSKRKSSSRPNSDEFLDEFKTPRQSTDKRHSRSPEKRSSRPHSGENQDEKRRSRHSTDKSKSRSPEKRSSKPIAKVKEEEYTTSQSSSNALSIDSLAKLNAYIEKTDVKAKQASPERQKERVVTGRVVKERTKHRPRESGEERRERKKTRVVSGPVLEEGRSRREEFLREESAGGIPRGCWILAGIVVLLLIILIPVGVLVIGKHNNNPSAPAAASATPTNGNLGGISESDIPPAARGGLLDPFTWFDTTDFNVTYTSETVGGLSVMGLNSTWNDTAQANQYVPPLNKKFAYGTMPIRGVNLGGWFSLEPFITPSMFNSYDSKLNIVDEYTLTQHLGPSDAAKTLEKHYAQFMNEQTFQDVQAAGFDHVRIPYSYWAVTTYPGDPYVPKISWRYLLRGIEYARKYGLRVNLDLHAVPGSQNGWNHSGRQGSIGWLNGTDGALNAQRSLDLHTQLSTFFAQPRYDNVVGIYGLVNEPKMTVLPEQDVLDWTTKAIDIVRQNGIKQTITFGDGFLGLPNWQGKLTGIDNLVMDAHQYVIFNVDQIAFSHQTKINFACSGWSSQMQQSINTATG